MATQHCNENEKKNIFNNKPNMAITNNYKRKGDEANNDDNDDDDDDFELEQALGLDF